MKINKIKIENYRLLKSFSIDLEKVLSVVLGKNNTGKTSFLSILDKFLNKSESNKFSFDDFNIDFKNQLKSLIEAPEIESNYEPAGIKLKLFIEYFKEDNLANVSQVMMNLDPLNNFIVLCYEYILPVNKLQNLRDKYQVFKLKEAKKLSEKEGYKTKDVFFFLKQNQSDYFIYSIKSLNYDIDTGEEDEEKYIELKKQNISTKDIINFNYIGAKRDVTNKESNSALSSQTSKIYKKTEATDDQNVEVEKFKDQLIETDDALDKIYETLFTDVVEKVKKFGGVKANDSLIRIDSSLKGRELLEGNTLVMYDHGIGNSLPEYHNGQGYMNLISMIFEIEIIIQDFKRKKNEKPADINLLFIEEPEAHTHPQMQYIFIKNIKDILKEGIQKENSEDCRELQTIISTHSSHIVSECDFDDIKYLKKEESNGVVAKNLKSLKNEYISEGEAKNFKFLKQYLTLHRSELFFAEKAILIEGDTERIILPAMMKKIDQADSDTLPLLSQNISVVEVGAHSQIFERFIDFIGLKKCLIITDIDSYYIDDSTRETVKCPASDANAKLTSNVSLRHYYGTQDLSDYKPDDLTNKTIKKNTDGKWVQDDNGHLLLVYQIEEESYQARSFEDAFFHVNKDFMKSTENDFPSLTKKWLDQYIAGDITEFVLAEKGVGSKPALAIEILLNSKTIEETQEHFSNWNIPLYIKQGLTWLKND